MSAHPRPFVHCCSIRMDLVTASSPPPAVQLVKEHVRQECAVVVRLPMARVPGEPSIEPLTIEALIEALDPEVRAAIDDVDRTPIVLSLQESPWERLRAASEMAQTLDRIREALEAQRGRAADIDRGEDASGTAEGSAGTTDLDRDAAGTR